MPLPGEKIDLSYRNCSFFNKDRLSSDTARTMPKTILLTGAPQKDDTITVNYALPAGVPVKTIRLEVLPDAANNNLIGRQENGKFTATPSFALNGESSSAWVRSSAL
jgi:hypothetical protein